MLTDLGKNKDRYAISLTAVLFPLVLIQDAIPILFSRYWSPPVNSALQTFNIAFTLLAILTVAYVQIFAKTPKIVVDFKMAHLAQVVAQTAVYVVWAIYFPTVFLRAPLIVYQIVLAYVCEVIFSVFFDRQIKLGVQNFPIFLSVNFFLWTVAHLFFIQLLMVPAAILFKHLAVRENDSGARSHIFNPSGIVMAVVIYAAMAMGKDLTYDIPATFSLIKYGPIYIFVFGILSQWVGGTMPIALGAFALFSAHHFLQPYALLDNAIFLGVTLLVTDPRTSPKTLAGQLVYGACYYLSVLAFHPIAAMASINGYYDKVYFLPVLNCFAPFFDRIPLPFGRLETLKLNAARIVTLMLYILLFFCFEGAITNPIIAAGAHKSFPL